VRRALPKAARTCLWLLKIILPVSLAVRLLQYSGLLGQASGFLAPAFSLTAGDLSDKTLADFAGKRKVLNIFPSVDTGVCAQSVRTFNERASSLENAVVLCISADLPFAQARFCGAEGLDSVVSLSTFRSVQSVSSASLEELTTAIGPAKARIVYQAFHAEEETEPTA